MNKVLGQADVERYRRDGIVFPVPILPSSEAGAFLEKLHRLEAREGGRLAATTNKKPHILVPWINDLIRDARLLDAVEDVLGPNIMCWGSQFFIKDAHDPGFISWHQDATYWGLSTANVVTAWIALTPSTVQSGCMRVVPGSHKQQVRHRETADQANMLSRGQEIAVDVDEREVVDVVLQPGEISLHNVLLFHSSKANAADHRRVGLAVRYVATDVRQTVGPRDSAMLVRGVDEFHYFDSVPAPEGEFHPEAVARHRAILERTRQIDEIASRQARDAA